MHDVYEQFPFDLQFRADEYIIIQTNVVVDEASFQGVLECAVSVGQTQQNVLAHSVRRVVILMLCIPFWRD